MAEVRKHDPDAGDGLSRLVREAIGETIRPVEPGAAATPPATPAQPDDDADAPPTAATLPVWDASGPTYNF